MWSVAVQCSWTLGQMLHSNLCQPIENLTQEKISRRLNDLARDVVISVVDYRIIRYDTVWYGMPIWRHIGTLRALFGGTFGGCFIVINYLIIWFHNFDNSAVIFNKNSCTFNRTSRAIKETKIGHISSAIKLSQKNEIIKFYTVRIFGHTR